MIGLFVLKRYTNKCTFIIMFNHILLLFTNMFRSLLWPSSGWLIARIQSIQNNCRKMYNNTSWYLFGFLQRYLWSQNIKFYNHWNTVKFGVYMSFIDVYSWFTSCYKEHNSYGYYSTNMSTSNICDNRSTKYTVQLLRIFYYQDNNYS
jgi:hypothetical protein